MIYDFFVTLQWHFQNQISDGEVKCMLYSNLYYDSCIGLFPSFFFFFFWLISPCRGADGVSEKGNDILQNQCGEHCVLPQNDTFLMVNAWALFQSSIMVKVKLSSYIQVLCVQSEGKQWHCKWYLLHVTSTDEILLKYVFLLLILLKLVFLLKIML